jgi:hypothetical protein
VLALKQAAETILKAAVDAASTSGDYTFLQFYQGTHATVRCHRRRISFSFSFIV